MPTGLPPTAQHWFRQTDKGKGIRLDAGQVDLLNAIGVGQLIREHAEFAANPRDFPLLPETQNLPWTPRVYFIQAGDEGPIKIGISGSPVGRVSALQVSVAEKLRLLAHIPGGRPCEMALHKFYRRERIRGEWFRPSLRLAAFIAEIAHG
jgi:hypothetical protein